MATATAPAVPRILQAIPLRISIALFVGFVCLSLTTLELQQVFEGRAAILRTAARETQNLSRSLALHADGVIGTADAVLAGLRERVETDGTGTLTNPAAMARMGTWMRATVAAESRFHGLFLFDEEGRLLANSVTGTPSGLNYADREFFRYLRDHDIDGPYIGTPVRSKADDSWIITVSRRLKHPDGSFAGVVNLTLSADLFQRFYAQFDVGEHGSIVLLNDDGRILIRHPFAEENVGRDISRGAAFLRSRGVSGRGSFEFAGLADQEQRMGSFDKVPRYHLQVIVTKLQDEVLGAWRHRSQVELLWLSIVIVAITALGYHLTTQLTQRGKAEARYQLLAEHCTDAITCLDTDGRRLYVSPSFWGMTGWRPEDYEGKSQLDFIVAEDHPAVLSAIALMGEGIAPQGCRYRYHTASGGFIWVELRASAVLNACGVTTEYVCNVRDITQQKLAEDELAEANAELSVMTLSDALTGIANRRNFDQTLRREWNRAMRSGRPLALLMIDADHFKEYNDQYGHLAGDECLKSLAASLGGAVRRAGDLVARYGGEEFAAILPDLTSDKAAIVAERMRLSLMEQTIAHERNPPGIVTVSIGVAAMMPGRGMEAKALLQLADEALYQAKREGRNRVAVLEPIREVRRLATAG